MHLQFLFENTEIILGLAHLKITSIVYLGSRLGLYRLQILLILHQLIPLPIEIILELLHLLELIHDLIPHLLDLILQLFDLLASPLLSALQAAKVAQSHLVFGLGLGQGVLGFVGSEGGDLFGGELSRDLEDFGDLL
jgi:hypothetical protein